MFAALSVRNYRIYAMGAIVSNTGTWMGRVAQDWVVLTELTARSASALGIVTGLQFLPMLLLAPVGGAIGDRFAKRRVMLVTQSVMALTAIAMGVMVLTGVMELWHMYVLAFIQGSAAAIDAPSRQAFVSEMVPPDRITNAVGLNSASFHGGRLLGPAAAGFLIAAFGTGPTLLINASTFVAVIIALVALNPTAAHPGPPQPGTRPHPRRHPLRAAAPRHHADHGAGLRARHLRHELPADQRADGDRGLRPGRGRSRPDQLDHGDRLTGRCAHRRPSGAPPLAAAASVR